MKTVAAVVCALMLLVTGARAQGPTIAIDVRNADIADVIALLANESGVNIVADSSVLPQKVTLHLQGVTFEQALSALVHSHDLEVRREGSVLIVGSAAAMNRRYGDASGGLSPHMSVFKLKHARAEDVSKAVSEALSSGTVVVPDRRTGEIIVTGDAASVTRAGRLIVALDETSYGQGGALAAHAITLRYLRPSEVVAQLKGVLPDGTYIADDRQNALIVTGNSEVQEAASAIVGSLDVPSPQVLFEVKVADVQPENDQSNVGIEFGGVDLSGQPLSGAATYAFTKTSVAVNARLNALVSVGRAKILATPKLMTLNNHEASLLIGQTYPVVFYDAKLGGQQVQFVDIGVKLRLTPTIGSDGSVTAEMHPEYSAIQSFVGGYPVLANRRVDSTLRVRDQQTIVLGGLLRDIDAETVTKVPYLADVPIFGPIFRNRSYTHERDEIVFLITPHVLTGNATLTR